VYIRAITMSLIRAIMLNRDQADQIF
jgi:hypothetical protein